MKKRLLLTSLFGLTLGILPNIVSCSKSTSDDLYIEALEDDSFIYAFYYRDFDTSQLPNLYMSLNNKDWKQVTINKENSQEELVPICKLSKGQKVYLKGNNPNGFSKGEDSYVYFNVLDKDENPLKYTCSGNIMRLIDGDNPPEAIPNDYCFTHLFAGTDYYEENRIVTGPQLPATKLSKECYSYMFFDDHYLTNAPELPSIDIQEKCYAYMFSQCISLRVSPVLPSSKTAPYCYDHMFYGNSNNRFIELHITDWDREGDFPCCFWVSFDGDHPFSEIGTFRCPKKLIPNVDDPNNFSETRVPYHWHIETFDE